MQSNFPSTWQLFYLEDCMDAIIDYRGKTPQKTSSGIPLITAKIVKGGRIQPVEEYTSPDNYDDWMRRGFPKPGDVLMTTEAPLGEIAQLDSRKVVVGQRLITLRGKEGFLDNSYLKFLMQSDFVQNQLAARATGTTVLGIKQSELRKVLLVIPPLNEQKAIAHILGTLDDKIELNRQMNDTLESIARALFKSWFIDFDPVRAKMEGRPPAGMDAETAGLFPAEFEDSALGKIPKGWKAGFLKDIAHNIKRPVRPEQIPTSTPYIGLEHMPKKCISLSNWGLSDDVESNKYRFKQGEILFGKLRPYFHKVGVASLDGVCSTDILVIDSKHSEYFGLTLAYVSSDDFVEYTNMSSDGTRMPRTSWQVMEQYPVTLPSANVAHIFNKHISVIVQSIRSNIFQSNSLSSIRETLLPKLLSGEIRIKDAEKIVEEVV